MNDEMILRSDLREHPATVEATPPPPTREAPPQTTAKPVTPLFTGEENRSLRTRWGNLQVGFVDEPRHAVEQADQLVSEAIRELATQFASEREKLEKQWHAGSDVSTEDLRLAFQRYRSFFERLLSV